MRQMVGILGTPIDVLDTQEVLARLEQFIQERRFHQVATANTDFLINALSDPELRHILRQADLVVPDGMPLVWASRLMGSPLPERVTGADIVPQLAALAARKGYRLYMVGARPEVAQRAKARLEADNPGLQIVGCVSPPAASIVAMDCEELFEDIARTAPDILLVAFGNPKQEKWIHLHRDRLRNVPVCIGVGGTFDFIAGEVARAPSYLQRSGLEWVHRLVQDPRRLWRRYSRDLSKGSGYLLRQWWQLRRQPVAGYSDTYIAHAGPYAILSLIGDFNRTVLPRFCAAAAEALDAGAHLVLDCQGMTSLDAEALGTLINLSKRAACCELEVRLLAVPPRIVKALRSSQVDDALYPIAPSMAHAFTEPCPDGLQWRVQCGKEAAVVTVDGASSPATACLLEKVCARLLESGKRLDLDARGITYVDACLISVLYRLRCQYAGCSEGDYPKTSADLRLIVGDTLRQALIREKMLAHFTLQDAPEIPHDASDLAVLALDMQRAGIGAESTHPETRPTLAVVSST